MNCFDLIGIGAGPANLSLAALSTKANINSILIEKSEKFVWHPGMLLPDAKLQVPFLNDLVTLADPTSHYSFLNFLSCNHRLYQFIAASFNPMARSEFNQYLQWVFNLLTNIKKGEEVLDVHFDDDKFIVSTNKNKYCAKNIVLGTGQSPHIPAKFQKYVGRNVYHNSSFMHQQHNFKGKRIAVIGGGQSGAEIFHHLIADHKNSPNEVYWISRRNNFSPLDDTPFTNELFSPTYINYFHGISLEAKAYLLNEHRFANDGISEYTARDIYQKLYELKFVQKNNQQFYLLPSSELIEINKINKSEYVLTMNNLITNEEKTYIVDKIIFCTGYSNQLAPFMASLEARLHKVEKNIAVNINYQVLWDGMDKASIYIQNGTRHTHGISDPTLSVAAYRSATILNSVTNKQIYSNLADASLVQWQ